VNSDPAISFDSSRPEGFESPQNYDPVLDFGHLVKCPGSASLLMVNQDYGVEEANQLVEEGKIDLVMIGRPFIYNPVRRNLQL